MFSLQTKRRRLAGMALLLAVLGLLLSTSGIIAWTYSLTLARKLFMAGTAWPVRITPDSVPTQRNPALLDQALTYAQRAAASRPANPAAYHLAALIYVAKADLPAAARSIEQARTLDRRSTVLAWDASLIYEQFVAQAGPGNATTSPQLVNALHDAGFDVGLLIGKGRYAEVYGYHDEALRWYQRAAELDPASAEAWYHVGLGYAQRKDQARALDAFGRASALPMTSRDTWYGLGTGFAQYGQTAAALNAFRQGLATEAGTIGTSAFYYQIGVMLQDRTNPPDRQGAEDTFRKALAANDFRGLDWMKDDIHQHLGTNLASRGQWTAALVEYQAVLASQPQDYRVLLYSSQALWESGAHAAAKARLQQVIGLYPREKAPLQQLAELYRREADLASARAMYQKILELDPQDTAARQALATLR